MLDELGRVTRCGRRAPASGVDARSHIAQFCSFPPRPSYLLSRFFPPAEAYKPKHAYDLPHSSPSCINALELDYKFTCKFTCKFKLTAAFQIPESARRHKSCSYPPLTSTTPTPPPHQALTRQHHTKEKTTSPLSPTACHRTGILYSSAGRDREITDCLTDWRCVEQQSWGCTYADPRSVVFKCSREE